MYIPIQSLLSSKKNAFLQQSFVKIGDLKKAIKDLLSQTKVQGEESASKSKLDELKKLESSIPECEKELALLRKQIQRKNAQILFFETSQKVYLELTLSMQNLCLSSRESVYGEELRELKQAVEKWEQLIVQKKNELREFMSEEKSKLDQLDKLVKDKQEKIQDLSAHEAQPQRYLGQLGGNLKTKASSNPYCKTWTSEVFPDWESPTSNLSKWEISLLIKTHLLTNWIPLIDKCSNRYFEDFLQLIIESVNAVDDGDDGVDDDGVDDRDNGDDSGGVDDGDDNKSGVDDGGHGHGHDEGDGGVDDGAEEATSSFCSQFFDVPNKEVTKQMIATLLYGQMACPSFPVLEKLQRFRYTAKMRQMFSNLFIFDRCRYVYDHFPSVHTSANVTKPHKQMVIRMAVDGLRKHLKNICDEDVFKCCNVVEEGMQERVPVIPDDLAPTDSNDDVSQSHEDPVPTDSNDDVNQSHDDPVPTDSNDDISQSHNDLAPRDSNDDVSQSHEDPASGDIGKYKVVKRKSKSI